MNTFCSSVYTGAGTRYHRCVKVYWYSENDTTNNKSKITWSAYIQYGQSDNVGYDKNEQAHYPTAYVSAKNVVLTINGTSTILVGSNATSVYEGTRLGGGNIYVTHGNDGTKQVSVAISAQFYGSNSNNSTYSGTIKMMNNPRYNLSISPGAGSEISVNRVSCGGVGVIGNITSGTEKLCKGDVLKISALSDSGYTTSTLSVNNANFISGNQYTVNGNVSIVSSAQALASRVGATNASIGSTSTITITKYNSSYYHSLRYSIGTVSGYINADGSSSSTEKRFIQTSVAFTVPNSFYSQIINDQSGVCTITCTTYSSGDSNAPAIGDSSSCTFTVFISQEGNLPDVNGAVIDMNSNTYTLTGNRYKLIRYKSTARCTISASGTNGASINSKSINNTEIPNGINIKDYEDVSESTFVFSATDSRGYTKSITIQPAIIEYIKLTCNPTIYRPSPSGSEIKMSLSGDFFNGSFGAYTNSLTIKYRYKEIEGTYPSTWTLIPNSSLTLQGGSYKTSQDISLGNNFDYQKEYIFEVKVCDGANNITLCEIHKEVALGRGLPVFDWGKDDFNVNGSLTMNSVGVMGFKNSLDTTTDLNSIQTAGIYIQYSDYSENEYSYYNYPCPNKGFLEVIQDNTNSKTIQRYTAISETPSTKPPLIYNRYHANGSWSSWTGDTGWIKVSAFASGDITEPKSTNEATLGHNGGGIFYRIVNGNHVYVCANVAVSNLGTSASSEKTIATLPSAINPTKTSYSICASNFHVMRSHIDTEGNLTIDWAYKLPGLERATSISWCDIYIDYFI